jgi:hypothetical protein
MADLIATEDQRYSPCLEDSTWKDYLAHSTCKNAVLTMVQPRCFTSGFSQNALLDIQLIVNILFTDGAGFTGTVL